ncbi:MAG: hypothetical protein Q8O89_03950 [Nanoarchaeota archaeon]|nr:hypothetical protein [Nanoarchaeota archaeon]
MNEKEKVLIENFKEYYEEGDSAFGKARFNTATILFFKAVATLCDLYLLRKEGNIPSSHSTRFRILEEKYHEIYKIMDRDFPFYQDSYTQKLDKETAELVKKDAGRIKKMLNL